MEYVGQRGMTPYYKEKLKSGLEYQDYVMIHLHRHGIVLQNIQSQKYQLKRENLLGMEIKHDELCGKTKNLYFETAEKTDPSNLAFIPSGILRNDETWLYGIGNHDTFWIFSKSRLRSFWERIKNGSGLLDAKITGNPTSRGFILPISQAEKICEKKIVFLGGIDGKPAN